jgi:hypothetical protein
MRDPQLETIYVSKNKMLPHWVPKAGRWRTNKFEKWCFITLLKVWEHYGSPGTTGSCQDLNVHFLDSKSCLAGSKAGFAGSKTRDLGISKQK